MDFLVDKKNKVAENVIILSSLLYIVDVLLISRLGQDFNLRVQDIASILSIFTCVYIISRYRKNRRDFSYIILSISIFFMYVIVSNLIFYAKGNINKMFVFYIGKEIEFFLCMFTIAYFSKNHNKWFYKILNILVSVNIIYGFYQIIIGSISYYGIGTIFEEAPSISGMIYFTCSIISFFMYKKFNKKKFMVYSLLTYALTIFTISKTSILGVTIFYVSFFILENLYKINIAIKSDKQNNNLIKVQKVLFTIIILILLIILIILFLNSKMINIILSNKLVEKIIYRFKLLSSSYSFRKNKTKFYYDYFIGNSTISMFFGCGKGITEFALDFNTLGVDNQFVRAIIELGLVGIILWLNILIMIINFIKKSELYINYCFIKSLFIAYLCMGIGYEVFVVTKGGIIFWFLVGVFISGGI